jgi:hypothetical protein
MGLGEQHELETTGNIKSSTDQPPARIDPAAEMDEALAQAENAAAVDEAVAIGEIAPRKHLLRIEYTFLGIDDATAREWAQGVLSRLGSSPDTVMPGLGVLRTSVKLQEIYDKKPPRKIEL